MSVTIRCGNPSCSNTTQADDAVLRTNRPADFLEKLPGRWSIAYSTLRVIADPSAPAFSFVCSPECAMGYAASQHDTEASPARNGATFRA